MTIGTQVDPVLRRIEKRLYFERQRHSYKNGNIINSELEYMITTSLEAGNYEGAFNTIEDIILGKQQCTRLVIYYLFDLILRPSQVYDNLSPQMILTMAQKARHMLLMILETFGSNAFMEIWDLFDDGKRVSSRGRRTRKRVYTIKLKSDGIGEEEEEEDEREEEIYHSSFSEFEHFQQFFASSVGYKDDFDGVKRQKITERGPSMRAPAGYKRRIMVLDVLLSVLEDDLYQTEGDPSALESCILVNKIINDHREIARWLDIIFKTMGTNIDEDINQPDINPQNTMINAEFGARMLNMMIAVSYCDTGIIESKDLVYQSFRRLSMLDVDGCSNMIQLIKFNTYTFNVLDTFISDSNVTNVQRQYKSMRKQKLTINFMDKFIKFDLNTQPAHLESIQHIYRHIQIIVWKLLLGTDIRQTYYQEQLQKRGHTVIEGITMTTEEQVKDTVVGVVEEVDVVAISRTTMSMWRRQVKDMLNYVKNYNDNNYYEIEKKIDWSISLVENIML
ncbi:hypothetical protein INT45_005196 [Circinella minor]|uniref:Uncharacterized protein n=1 Tax=Circinella minor TaxID=1195481 RepID=A0A8H7S4K1_9FUNG|nr:hypothetical protein INT45_005196 [Circinella minor]